MSDVRSADAGNISLDADEAPMKRILLVDDHPAVQMGLRELLHTEFPSLQVEFANNEETAVQALEKGHWDAAIVDISLPGKGGLDLIKILKENRPLLKVLIYTMHHEQELGLRAIRSGADGYLMKDCRPEILFQAVGQVLSGRKYLSSSLAEQLALAVGQDERGEKYQKLSNREYDVFVRVARGESLSEIAATLDINIKTVGTYRARILEKLEVSNNSELVRYALRHGLVNDGS
jgi:two-component system invasion response regulator UvrY